jgi:diaminohydroxyphosphoribosylaminopyrimidine deaminase / 5-amino-6-(5-phosphoribosylamino)uracil reductase
VQGDESFMRRAIELAERAGFTSPNPRVGVVLVKQGMIVAEGHHEGAGRPHAEAVALAAALDARGSTAYVNLEPCVHHGRTPPCAPALAEAGVARVVVGTKDPDERVAGRGIDYLQSHGIAVELGVLAEDAWRLNAPYLHHRLTGRPWISLKLALSLDGRLAAPDRSARWITGPRSRRRVHARRARVDAVLVGAGTVVSDNPWLTVRAAPAARQPVKVVLDSRGEVGPGAAVFAGGTTIVGTSDRVTHEAATAWKEAGAEVVTLAGSPEGVDLFDLVRFLGDRGFLEVYCEGGARLATSLLKADLVNRLELHYGPITIGSGGPGIGDLGVTAMTTAGRWKLIGSDRLDDDVLVAYERKA